MSDDCQAAWELYGCRTIGSPADYFRAGWKAALHHHDAEQMLRQKLEALRVQMEAEWDEGNLRLVTKPEGGPG